MVKVVVTGGNSGLGLEVIDALSEGHHEVLALARKEPSQFPQFPGVTWKQTSYQDRAELVELFKGADVVLNFIVLNGDPGNEVSIRIIDAVVEAGVPRYAPSEWAMGQKLKDVVDVVPWYQGKLDVQKYLADINKDKQVLEYTLFQVGMFLEYAAYPRRLSKYTPVQATLWQLNKARIVGIRGYENDPVTVTSVRDIAGVVRRAVEYKDKWPVIGGIQGQQVSVNQFKKVVEDAIAAGKGTGILPPGTKTITVDLAEEADLAKGELNIEMPLIEHPSIPEEMRKLWHVPGWTGSLLATARGAWTVSDEWNQLLPDYKFTSLEEFVATALKDE
ncbi:hypothetical protein SEUCBS139899_002353 [Sporothrix eucalyptigena]|uniref:NmrA-like domain-containing protein n=1 Tax=Sporothrix eucalyptigena TaxID=1812306 RepID=A0ABP0CR67_9PEZI